MSFCVLSRFCRHLQDLGKANIFSTEEHIEGLSIAEICRNYEYERRSVRLRACQQHVKTPWPSTVQSNSKAARTTQQASTVKRSFNSSEGAICCDDSVRWRLVGGAEAPEANGALICFGSDFKLCRITARYN